MRTLATCVSLLFLLLCQEAATQNIPYFTPTRDKVRWIVPQPHSDSIHVSPKLIALTNEKLDTLGLDKLVENTRKLIEPVLARVNKDERIEQLEAANTVLKTAVDDLSKMSVTLEERLKSMNEVVKEDTIERARRRDEETNMLRRMTERTRSIDRIKHYRDSLSDKVKERFGQKLIVALVTAQGHKSVTAKTDSINRLLNDSLAAIRLESEALMSAHRTMERREWVAVDGLAETTRRFYDPFFKNDSKFLQSNILTVNTSTGNGALYSEIFHDYIGPLRIGLGGLLSNAAKGDSTAVDSAAVAQDQAQRVLGGGGNAVATFGMPLVGYTSSTGVFMFRTTFQPKLALDLTRYEQDQVEVPFHADLGFEVHTSLSGRDGILSFFASARPSLLIGNPAFYDNLATDDLRSLAMAQVRFGIGINNVLRIGYAINAGSPFIQRTFPSQLSVTILTSGLKAK